MKQIGVTQLCCNCISPDRIEITRDRIHGDLETHEGVYINREFERVWRALPNLPPGYNDLNANPL
jgi:hypothetical protein